MAGSQYLHPALTVTNIRNFIPLTLETESGKYTSWAELFKIHCRAFLVIDHIIPPPADDKGKAEEETIDPKLLKRLDAIVLQWIYGTISPDLLETILEPDTTAHKAWVCLQGIFQDNKHSRAVSLENQFSQVLLDDLHI